MKQKVRKRPAAVVLILRTEPANAVARKNVAVKVLQDDNENVKSKELNSNWEIDCIVVASKNILCLITRKESQTLMDRLPEAEYLR